MALVVREVDEAEMGSDHGNAATQPPVEKFTPMEIEDAAVVTEDTVQKYSKDDDEAMKAFARYQGPPLILDEATNKRLLRTIDWHLMPIL
jgi:ACS family allantoate permease-like MFS transporter